MNLLHSWISSNSDSSQKLVVLRNKWDRLCARESDVRLELENAEIQPGKKRKREVDVWLRHVELKRTEFGNISNEAKEHGFRSQLTRRVDMLTKEIEDLLEHGRFQNGLLLDDSNSRRVPLVVTDLVGKMLEVTADKISLWLKNDDVLMIGVYGMGGVGKTTLLMHVHNQLLHDFRISGHVYWVTVSQDCSLYKLQHNIAKAICLDLSIEKDDKKRAAILHSRLANMGPTIFILDDMWKHVSIEDIGIPVGANSCKVILTTRLLEVCRRMGCKEAVVKLEPLAGNEAWKLFIDKLENYEALSMGAKQKAELVAKECGGLPLAIITMACSMRGVYDIFEWQNALAELRNPVHRLEDMENDVLQKLKYSYDRLNDEKVQQCFLSCILYPEDYPIWRGGLIEHWVMEGLLDDIESRQDQVNKGYTILKKLENACLLESAFGPDCVECVKMHDVIRDMAILITQNHPRFMAKPGLQIEQLPGEGHWSEDLVKVSLMDNKIEEIPYHMSPRCPKLSVLLLHKNPLKGIPDSFFVHMSSLAVLDLSATKIKRLPSSVSDLENLRLLLLRFCANLIYVPSLAKLRKLRVLNLYGTGIEEAPLGMEGLRELEEVSCGWKLSHVDAFNKYIESQHFQQLHCYGFWLYKQGGDSEGPGRLLNKEVVISGEEFRKKEPAPWLPHDMQLLEIDKCSTKESRSLEDIFPSLYKAKELKNLHVRECTGLEYILSGTQEHSSPSVYPPLETVEYLELFDLCDLKGLLELGGVSPSGIFSHLKILMIEACSRIKMLFPLNLFEQGQILFPCLQQIHVAGCAELVEIFAVANNCSAIAALENAYPTNFFLTLPSLRVLKLWDLPKLRCIYSGLMFCTSLQEFCADECPKLDMLPLSIAFLCDSSPSSLDSLPNNPHWWQWLRKDHPHDANQLLSLINRPQSTNAGCIQLNLHGSA
ncbi:putative disease resistance protein At4g10780 [Chenopodium quinoa]|uniref:putative disease resistance protein At4g10780 n=1 Tax=Chenopodium quinoa TaxID=63459 RepID=UPI000B76FF9C|nr:putative disease resistance protein At4g10780 [Chenopodium quinoa]